MRWPRKPSYYGRFALPPPRKPRSDRDPHPTIKPHGGIKTPTPCSTPPINPGNH
jgi:hypothetical protein